MIEGRAIHEPLGRQDFLPPTPGSRVCYFEPPLPLLVRRSTCRPHDG